VRKAAVGLVALLSTATAGLCAPPGRREVIDALMARSRLLADARFRIPVSVWEQYERERRLPPAAPAPPVDATAVEGAYHLTVPAPAKDGAVRPVLKAAVTVRVLAPAGRWEAHPLPPGPAWAKVTVNGKPAHLPRVKGRLLWRITGTGRHVLTAEAPLAGGEEGGSVDLDVLPTARTLVRFDSTRAWQVWDNVQGAWAPPGPPREGTHRRLAARPTGRVRLAWRRPVPVHERPPRYALRGQVAWNLGAAAQEVTAALNVRLIGGRTDRIDLRLPAAAERVAVSGPDVREGRVNGGGELAVFLRGKVRGQTHLTLRYELPAGAGHERRLGTLAVRDGHWAGGALVITNTAGGSEVVPAAAEGLKPLALAEVPREARAILRGAPALAYAITGRRFDCRVDLLDLGQFALTESIADLACFELMLEPGGRVLCKARYEVRNRTRQFVTLSLPARAVVLAARVNEQARPLTPVAGRAGSYRLPLVRSKASVSGLVSFPVEVVLLCRTPALAAGRGELDIPLPRVDIPIAYAWCQAYVPEGMKVRRWSGPLANVARYSSETAVAHLGYGRGELAEGYRQADRLRAVTAPPPPPKPEPEARPKPKPKPKARRPEPKKPRPKKAKKAPPMRPDAPGPLTSSRLVGGATPATRPAAQPAPAPQPARPGQPPPRPTGQTAALLARNYYRSGREFYAANDYTNAAVALKKVVELAPKSPEATNASRLLGNIDLARGRLALRTRGEQAAAAKVRQEQQEALQPAQERQRQMLAAARRAVREGRYGQARAQLRVAESLARKYPGEAFPGGQAAPAEAPELSDVRRQLERAERARAARLREQYKRFRDGKDFNKAMQTARALQQTVGQWKTAEARKEVRELQSEMEALAVRSTKEKARILKERSEAEQVAQSVQVTTGAMEAPPSPQAGAAGQGQGKGPGQGQAWLRRAPHRAATVGGTAATDEDVRRDAARLNELLRRPRQVEEQRALAEAIVRTPGSRSVKVLLPPGADPYSVTRALRELYGPKELRPRRPEDLRAETAGDRAIILTGPAAKVDRAVAVLTRMRLPPRDERRAEYLARAVAKIERPVDAVIDLRPPEGKPQERTEDLHGQLDRTLKATKRLTPTYRSRPSGGAARVDKRAITSTRMKAARLTNARRELEATRRELAAAVGGSQLAGIRQRRDLLHQRILLLRQELEKAEAEMHGLRPRGLTKEQEAAEVRRMEAAAHKAQALQKRLEEARAEARDLEATLGRVGALEQQARVVRQRMQMLQADVPRVRPRTAPGPGGEAARRVEEGEGAIS